MAKKKLTKRPVRVSYQMTEKADNDLRKMQAMTKKKTGFEPSMTDTCDRAAKIALKHWDD